MKSKNQIQTAQIVISRQKKDPCWDAFVASNPVGQYEQTSAWAQAKSIEGWNSLRIFLRSNRNFYGGAQILYKNVSIFGKIAYVINGPLFALSSSSESIRRFLAELILLARREHFLYLFVQPPDDSALLEALFLKAGFRVDHTEILHKAGTKIDLRADLENIFANLVRGNRQSIRRCEREGIKVREGTREEIRLFFNLMLESCRRQGNSPNPASEDFFRVLWDNIESSGGKLKLFFAECKNTLLSGAFLIGFGKIVKTWKMGWSGHMSKIRPTQVMVWESIKWAKNEGYRFYDFIGISRETAEGLLSGKQINKFAESRDFFKLMFGGQVYLLPPGYVYCFNPVLTWIYTGFVNRIAASKRLRPLVNRMKIFIRRK